MFNIPNWFNKWNDDNPTDVFGPAIVIGAAGGAVLLAAIIISYSNPWATASTQTGPRGIGMSVTKSPDALIDPSAAAYDTAGGDAKAAMQAWTGIPDLFEDPDNYQTQVAYTMIAMTQSINEGWSDHVGEEAGVNCYTCHRGEPVPTGIWFNVTPVSENANGWAAVQNQATAVSQSTSLPSDMLQKYLVDGETISVHDLDARVPHDPDLPTWQNAERTYSLMNYFANSLNVNCVFCHNSRAFYDTEQVTPQWGTAQLGIGMVQEINNDWLLTLDGVLPEERLGPMHGDLPKAGCMTCHKGYQKPMNGLSMVADWPSLTDTSATVIE